MPRRIISTKNITYFVSSTTGDSSVIAGQGTGTFILVDWIYAFARTTAANQVLQLKDGATTTSIKFRAEMATKSDAASYPFPFRLSSGLPLVANMATAGVIDITVGFSVERED